jgi:predicted ATP-grasp superfamily ATP-dependent carboligase
MHLDACGGVLPDTAPAWPGAAAAAVVYATASIRLPPHFTWPAWAADRQGSGEAVARGAPICTVLSEAEDAASAERLVHLRAADILARVKGEP